VRSRIGWRATKRCPGTASDFEPEFEAEFDTEFETDFETKVGSGQLLGFTLFVSAWQRRTSG
jgi:hypothetical protein